MAYGQTTVYGIKSTSPNAVITNENNFTLSSSIFAYGIYASGNNPTILNSGDFNLTSAYSFGIYTPSTTGTYTNIFNAGNFNISGSISSAGIYTLGNNSTVTNTATINSYATGVSSDPTISFGIDAENASNVAINNKGNLNVFGNPAVADSIPIGIFSSGNNVNINNSGNINVTGATGQYDPGTGALIPPGGIVCYGCSGTITNSGVITVSSVDTAAYGIYNTGSIDMLNNTNSGAISAESSGSGGSYGIYNAGTVNSLINSGSVSAPGSGIQNSGEISILTNLGSISSSSGNGISNNGVIANLNNLGSIVSDSGIGIYSTGTIHALNNSGNITLGDFASYGIYNNGAIGVLINSGVIAMGLAPTSVLLNDILGRMDTLSNSGLISAGNNGPAIVNLGTISTLKNSGTISVGNNGGGIVTFGAIGTLVNSGSIVGGPQATGIGIDSAGGSVGVLTNTGTIVAGNDGSAIFNGGYVNILNNTGALISGDNNYALQNSGSIYNLTNSGQITAGQLTSGIGNTGVINVLTNIGFISAGTNGFGIDNTGTIGTLNNSQGGNSSSPSTTMLTYKGDVPGNYNIGIASPTHYGQLAVSPTGSTVINNFGIYGTPFLTSRTYTSVLTNNVTVTNLQSTYDNMTLALVDNGSTYDLTFAGASLMGTQQSLVNTANALAPIYTLQNSVLANSFAYDCTEFGINNICVSVGGRNTAVSAANGLNNTSALLIAAYRPHPNYRVGAYADQNLSVNNAGSTVNLGNNTPLIGLFGAWNEGLDGTRTEVKVSAAYGQKNTTVTRQVVGLSEPGSGSSQLNSQGAQITAKYGFGVTPDVIVSPYIGMRYTQNNMNGYTEGASSSVTAPLTYAALNTNATTALAGVGVSYKIVPQVTTFASAGVESDTNTANGTYSATGINGLTPVNFNPNPVKTRPTATLGAFYDIVKNQRLGITGIYRQEPFQSVSTTTVMATYTVGL